MEQYSLVLHYRVSLVKNQDRDLDRAALLRQKLVDWRRSQTQAALALPVDAPLVGVQRNRIHTAWRVPWQV